MLKSCANSTINTEFGVFDIHIYVSADGKEQIVLTRGDVSAAEPILLRIHSECITSEVLHSLDCDCVAQLTLAFKKIDEANRGMIIYLRQEGRGIGLVNKIKSYELQHQGMDTVEAHEILGFPIDARDYSVVKDILEDRRVTEIIALTNNPDKIKQLSALGIAVIKREALEISPTATNRKYLSAKKTKMGHWLDLV
ncbi:MAG: GTP cyclohydrolase II [Candidatus Magasanikbacteria bacterium RIFCSPHIGHO2_01_FULL_41_23]|uniref:GTP cyclohydrolase II n=1 Tax=Candidatus Magasanikbacteria bacterium RIFCSPLOWO2_01_FULL_40_15 TaxID=1798686 RepID=A0A1F6N2Q4_9BACT|nr:MAG: GTP cyclohydrolase II [Candidatus Magasanikbacteria bacterium RIFCSPHIGHO2_01_FULL_41_23]OGH66904.1 MAG: GTP cyclohydrolase II [Candidatus Magasanikbacteria bacterium RIFCSPHIGHO2_02_FULL_41_35]OGH74888.1 MAG: GTP cyclohydrolase II [Candidatus Magasanikbacteria bacterium RIFCSPHIGHO2_12_FULL_41_16]OGH78161.1 MAG: GTP cyclohydrolase II [Candidatus Magasanikbacteria bacterium RIFCSPLOWO2_01_FULL_40_15]